MTMHSCTREIGIDAAHRVTYHGSKCRNLHGHRYTIQATCQGPLAEVGEQQGMVIDFGFLKDLMLEFIDGPCDHGTIVWIGDTELVDMLRPPEIYRGTFWPELKEFVDKWGSWTGQGRFGKLHIVPFVPTAENLARHWFRSMFDRVPLRANGAVLRQVRVWETPNSFADFPCL